MGIDTEDDVIDFDSIPDSKPSFEDFPDIPNIEPFENKKTIVVSGTVVNGVGDLMHMISFTKLLRELFPKYKIFLMPHCEDEKKAKLIENSFPNEDLSNFVYVIPRPENDEKDERIQAILSNTTLSFSISYGLGIDEEYLEPFFIPDIIIPEISTSLDADEYCESRFPSAYTMGLSAYEGIKIKDCAFDLDTRTLLLHSIANDQYDFKSTLLGTNNPSRDDCKKYLETHHFMPAYLQTGYFSVAYFIALHVLKHYNPTTKTLTKPCDFHVPAQCTSQPLIVAVLKKLGFEDVFFLDKNTKEGIFSKDNPNQIRIITNRIESNEDYEKTFYLDTSGAGYSGDNSFEHVVSSLNLPFWEKKRIQIWRFAEEAGYLDVGKYLSIAYGGGGIMLPVPDKDMQDTAETFIKMSEQELQETKDDNIQMFERILQRAKLVKTFLQEHPNIEAEWQQVRKKILQEHNIYNVFPTIVKTGLFISQEHRRLLGKPCNESFYRAQEYIKKILTQKENIQVLIQHNILNKEEAYDLGFFRLLALCNKKLTYVLLNNKSSYGTLALLDDFTLYNIVKAAKRPSDIKKITAVIEQGMIPKEFIKQLNNLSQTNSECYFGKADLLTKLSNLSMPMTPLQQKQFIQLLTQNFKLCSNFYVIKPNKLTTNKFNILQNQTFLSYFPPFDYDLLSTIIDLDDPIENIVLHNIAPLKEHLQDKIATAKHNIEYDQKTLQSDENTSYGKHAQKRIEEGHEKINQLSAQIAKLEKLEEKEPIMLLELLASLKDMELTDSDSRRALQKCIDANKTPKIELDAKQK